MSFRKCVQSVPALAGSYQQGLQALLAHHRGQVVCSNPHNLKGSIDIDKALEDALPNAPRWDYGIGYYNGRSEEAIWIEIHPASSDHVSHLTRKVKWLRTWLHANANSLLSMTRKPEGYMWLSTGSVSIQRGSRQARELAMAGVSFPRKQLKLN